MSEHGAGRAAVRIGLAVSALLLALLPAMPATAGSSTAASSTAVSSPRGSSTGGSSTAASSTDRGTAPADDLAAKPCTGTSPKGIYAATLSFTVSSITPQVVTAEGPSALTVTGIMTNTGQQNLADLGYKFQRGDALVGEQAIRREVANPCQPITVVDTGFLGVVDTLAPGASTSFSATVPIPGDPNGSLAVAEPGVYPVMINFNATVALPPGDIRARVGEVHLLLTVLSVPRAPTLPGTQPGSSTGTGGARTGSGTTGTGHAGTGGNDTSTTGVTTHPPIPFSMVWTVVDRPHLGVGGIFLDDDLVPEISPGGRLYELIRTLTSTTQVPGSTTLAVDPELLDELDRMSDGYWVLTPQGSTQAALTPTPNGTTTTIPSATDATNPTNPTEATTAGPNGTSAGSVPGDDGASHQGAPPGSNAGQGAGSATDAITPSGTAGTTAADLAADSTATAADTQATAKAAITPNPSQTTQPGQATGDAPDGGRPANTVAGTGQQAALAFLDQLRRLAAATPTLVLPYSDPDAVALVRAGMSTDLAGSVYLGRAVASRVLGVTPPRPGSTSTLITELAFPVGGLADRATLSALSSVGISGVILTRTGVTGLANGSSVTSVAVGGSGMPGSAGQTTLAAMVPNASLLDDIEPYLTSGVPGDAAMSMNLIAGVAAGQYLSDASEPLLVVPPRDWIPDDAGVDAITSLFSAMSDEGAVVGMDLRSLAKTPTGSGRVRYPSSAKAQELPPSLLRQVAKAGAAITSLRVSLTEVAGPEGGDPADVLDPLQEALTRVTAAAFRDNQAPADRVLATVTGSLRAVQNGLTVASSGGSLTLASSSAPLRLTLVNNLPYDARVRITISGGERVGLTTTDPGVQLVPAGRSVPVTVPAHVARSGTFSIKAQLTTVDGHPWGSAVTLQVNSRAYGALTLVLLLVAGTVLVLMVVIRIIQRARARHPQAADSSGSTAGGAPDGSAAGPDPGSGETPLTAADPADLADLPDGPSVRSPADESTGDRSLPARQRP